MPTPNIYNLSQWNWIADRVGEGYSAAEVARFVGLSNVTVLNNLERIGRRIPECEREPLDNFKQEFNAMFNDGSPDVCKPGKAVIAVSEDGTKTEYKTISEAARAFGARPSKISVAVKNHTRCRGHRFYLADAKDWGEEND